MSYGIGRIGSKGQTYIEDSNLSIPKGEIAGHASVNKFGRTTNADSGIATDVWDRANATNDQDVWLSPTAARVHTVVSTSDLDGKTAAPSSVGARTIRIYGLTSWSTAETSEDITLDGTTGVNTTNSYVIIHRIKVLTCGTSGPNVGYITATAVTDGSVTAQINPSEGQTQMAIYGVPSTQTAYLTGWYASINKAVATAQGNISLLASIDQANTNNEWQVKHTTGLNTTGTSTYQHHFNPYNGFAGPVVLKLQVVTGQNDCDVSGGFDLILVNN